MKPDRVQLIAWLFASVGFLLYPLVIDSYSVWFEIYSDPWYSAQRFLRWFIPIPITALILGLLCPLNRIRLSLPVGSIIIFLFAILGLISGSQFTMEISSQEYVIHFLMVQTLIVFYSIGIGMLSRYLIISIDEKRLLTTGSIALLVGAILGGIVSHISFAIIQRWSILCLLLGVLALLLFRQFKSSLNDHENN